MKNSIPKNPTGVSDDPGALSPEDAKTAALLEVSELRAIRMEGFAADRDCELADGESDGDFQLGMAFKFDDRGDKGLLLHYRVSMSLAVAPEHVEYTARIQATYRVTYVIKPDTAEPADEIKTRFGERVTIFAAWPYWREFAQSSAARMGLPPISLPLLRHGMLADESSCDDPEMSNDE